MIGFSCRPSHLMHNPWPTWVAKEGGWLLLRTQSWAHGSCSPSYGESPGTRKHHHVCSLLMQNWSNLNIWTWLHLRNYMTHWKIEAVQRIRTQRHLQNDVRYIHRHIHVYMWEKQAWGLPQCTRCKAVPGGILKRNIEQTADCRHNILVCLREYHLQVTV